MRIAICEDIKKEALLLKEAVARYLRENQLSAVCELFTSGEAFLAAFVPGKYQIVFMDIFMTENGLNGMETATRLKELDEEVAVIFTTTTTEYGIEGYRVSVYYIVKPVVYDEVATALHKCRAVLERHAKTVSITVNRQSVSLRLRDIYYVEALQRNCVFVTTRGEYTSARPIAGLAELLGGLPFLRCHRSYLVNLHHVQALENRDFILTDGCRVPISKHSLPAIRSAFRQFLRDELRENDADI